MGSDVLLRSWSNLSNSVREILDGSPHWSDEVGLK